MRIEVGVSRGEETAQGRGRGEADLTPPCIFIWMTAAVAVRREKTAAQMTWSQLGQETTVASGPSVPTALLLETVFLFCTRTVRIPALHFSFDHQRR